MVCIYCASKTSVTNSRPQKRLNQTWRRRECQSCGAIFTSIEAADLSASLRVRLKDGQLVPFDRDKLFISLLRALDHRKDAVPSAAALTATITVSIVKSAQNASCELRDIISEAETILHRFDATAGAVYKATHSN